MLNLDQTDFYSLGLRAKIDKLTIQQAFKEPKIWGKLKLADDEQVAHFIKGLYGEKRPEKKVEPAPPVVVPEKEPEAEPPAIQELTLPDTGDLRAELELLKKLVTLLEAKLDQPLQINVATPKLVRSVDNWERDDSGNIKSGKVTDYEYEGE
jgi:hypothetical protein